MAEIPTHPLRILETFGIRDTRFAAVSAYLWLLTFAFVAIRAHFFILRSIATDGTSFVWWLAYILPIALLTVAACVIVVARQRKRILTARQIEAGMENDRFKDFREVLFGLLERSGLSGKVDLRYDFTSDIPNARVSKRDGRFFITATRGLWQLSAADPQSARSILAHEVSHIEMDDIQRTAFLKMAARLAFLILLGTNFIALTVYAVRHFEFYWVDEELQFFGLIAASLVPSFAMFLFYQEYLVGRELLHDLRAVQLVGDETSLYNHFQILVESDAKEPLPRRWRRRLSYVINFHPTASQRLSNLKHLDLYESHSLYYPLLAGAFLALLPIEIGWIASDLAHYEHSRAIALWDSQITWVWAVINLFVLLRTDISRLSMDAIRRNLQALQFLRFCLLVTLGALLATAPFLLLELLVRHRPLLPMFEYLVAGGLWAFAGYVGMGLCMGYLFGVRYLQHFRSAIGWLVAGLVILWCLGVTTFFNAISLSRESPSSTLFAYLFVLLSTGVLLCTGFVLLGGCPNCFKRTWNSLLLKNKCTNCGSVRIPELIRGRVSSPANLDNPD
jgi:Zn-dependent protease with chaperone function